MHKRVLLAASAITLLAGTVLLTPIPALTQGLSQWSTKTVLPKPKKHERNLVSPSNSSLSAAKVTGHWFTYNAKSVVRITKCGAGLCGRIVWLRKGLDSTGRPVRDERNRDKQYRTRQVLGLATFSGLAPSGPRRWSGLMYNPDDGHTYKGLLTFLSPSSIHVKGCRLGGGTCGERNWVRAKK